MQTNDPLVEQDP